MVEPWTFAGEAPPVGAEAGHVTLVEGSTFCLSGRSGDLRPDHPDGLFFLDTRLLSRLALTVEGAPPDPLAVHVGAPSRAVFVGRVRVGAPPPGVLADDGGAAFTAGAGAPGGATDPAGSLAAVDPTLLVLRRRYVGQGLREDLSVRNTGRVPVAVRIGLRIDADFADLFAVKEGRAEPLPRQRREHPHGVELRHRRDRVEHTVEVTLSEPAEWDAGRALWSVTLAPRDEWCCCVELRVAVDGEPIPPRYPCGAPIAETAPEQRRAQWTSASPVVVTDHVGLAVAVRRAVDDLGSLRIFDPENEGRAVIAAGAPWFMTLFGRDSLLTAWMALFVDPDLALGVLQTLARLQGSRVVAETEEQPGRILHEVRFGTAPSMRLGDGHIYYGTVDATPLFVMLLGELRRWGLARAEVDALLPHADRALAWIEEYGDRDGDGYVEYERLTPHGLANQGWKDSWDGITFADGTVARAPIALCEVQGYVYAAYLARAHFADEIGDLDAAIQWRDRAARLKDAFNRDFWLADRGWYALGLDAGKRPIDALASNMGHCLWTGIVDEDKAPAVAEHLLSGDMFTGFGLRTLAASMGAYDPLSYHNGSVWPHDTAIAAAGLMRYGFVEHAHRLVLGLLDAAAAHSGRLPELFAGIARDDVATPVRYPASCSPQAWAAASPLLLVRTLLRLDPWVPHGKVWCAPALPPEIGRCTVHNLPLDGRRVTVRVEGDEVDVDGLGDGVELVAEPRPPLTAPWSPPPRPSSSGR